MTDFLTIFNLVLSIGLAVGGLAAFRHGITSTPNEVQERVIHALESEINALKDRLSELEKENVYLERIIKTIRTALRRRGVLITIDGEMVSIRDRSGRTIQATRIHDVEPDDEEEEDFDLWR